MVERHIIEPTYLFLNFVIRPGRIEMIRRVLLTRSIKLLFRSVTESSIAEKQLNNEENRGGRERIRRRV